MATSPTQKRAPLPPQQYPAKPKAGMSKGQPKHRGPQPARHIPWPEIFKHHISLVEGHLKMIEMVRKHTVEGSGNYNTISDLVKRSKDMLYQAKNVARTFIPPPDLIDQVPLGSSSDTMYPGYSPANHEYGKAAEEFGRYASEAKKKGLQVEAEGIDYKVGQSRGLGHMTLAQIRAANAKKGGAGSGSDAGSTPAAPQASKAAEKKKKEDEAETQTAGEQMFFMDSNPTPVNLSTAANSSAKRKATPDPVEVNTSKKQKKKQHAAGGSPAPDDAQEPIEPVRIEFEDISGEVDARLAEKEERRKRKEQKKRKRESEGSGVVPAAAAADKPEKKKVKATAQEETKKRSPDEVAEGEAVGNNKKRKKAKTSPETTKKRGVDEVAEGEAASHKKEKKQKRAKTQAS
ncbi:MAG: hypothetical protein LQ344_005702 [Seirophora lacunosa]|nr:MAG: hypothetical protein LQ344_005702 [Seirophora lacunosa]